MPEPLDAPALFASYSGLLGGAERVLLDHAGALSPAPLLACPEGPLAHAARSAGLCVLVLPPRRLEMRDRPRDTLATPVRLTGHARELRALVRALRPAIVVTWGARSILAAVPALAGLAERPALLHHHDDLLGSGAAARAVRAACARADAVVTVSQTAAADLDPAGLRGRLAVVPPGVDLNRFAATPLPEGAPRALVLGAIVDWKRPGLALEAVAIAAREVPDLSVTVAGAPLGRAGGELLDALRARARAPDLAGRVEFSGATDDPAAALGAATCLLHGAEREAFGLVAAEAMASARPVVAPAAGATAELVGADCGRLYRPGDPRDAARALVDGLGDAAALGRAGRTRAEKLYDARAARARFAEIVERTARDRGRPSSVTPTPHPGAGLALVTVTHQSAEVLPGFLRSVESFLPAAEVIVVDSGSTDASASIARDWPGGATVMDCGENVGFGRATNAGVRAARAPVCVLINPDVELVDSSPAELAARVAGHGSPERILAPLVLRPDGSRQDSAHVRPASLATAIVAVVPPVALPAALRRRLEPWRANRPRRVAWAIGACLVARTETWRRLGPFDPRAFLYAEDLELGLRARSEGVETWLHPDARVLHHAAHSSLEAFGGEPYELLARRRHEVVLDRLGPQAARWDHRIEVATAVNRLALRTLLRRPVERERRRLAALRSLEREDASA